MLLAVAVLVITNIGMVFFILHSKKMDKRDNRGGGKEQMMRSFLKDDVGFDDVQLQQFDTLSRRNKEKMKADFDQVRAGKQDLYKELGSRSFSDSAIHDVALRSSAMQEQMELKMLQHFKDIRGICTPGQAPKFDTAIWKIWNKPPDRKKDDR